MKTLIIGDVHGKIKELCAIIEAKNIHNIILLGDIGFTHSYKQLESWMKEKYTFFENPVLTIVPGNHDAYDILDKIEYMNVVTTFAGDDNLSTFAVRGAYSIDKHLRTEGVDYFANEELSYTELQSAIDSYIEAKPKYMFSHDCPQSIAEKVFGITDKSITRNALQCMYEEHQPEIWFFGHHHKTVIHRESKTEFICLDELDSYTIDF